MSRATMICMLLTSLAVGVGCSAQPPKVIAQKLCDQFDQANANHDLNQVLGFFDSSFVGTDEHGKRASFAELRKQMAQNFPLFRRWNPMTTVDYAQLQADRLVVYYKAETHFEFHGQPNAWDRDGWVPEISKASGETTWERKSGQWKIVQSTTYRTDIQVDPKYEEAEKVYSDIIKHHYEAAQRVAESMGNTRH